MRCSSREDEKVGRVHCGGTTLFFALEELGPLLLPLLLPEFRVEEAGRFLGAGQPMGAAAPESTCLIHSSLFGQCAQPLL